MAKDITITHEWTTSAGLRAVTTLVGTPEESSRRFIGLESWRCGYVELLSTHPLYDQACDELDPKLSVHGGITFSANNHELLPPGWWVGFDCAHGGDTPEVCNQNYVDAQCESLAQQLKELSHV